MIVGGLVAAVFGFHRRSARRCASRAIILRSLLWPAARSSRMSSRTLNITGGALGLNTGAIYSNAKTLLPYAVSAGAADGAGDDEPQALEARPRHHGHPRQPHRGGVHAASTSPTSSSRCSCSAAFFAGAAGTLYGHFFANVKAAAVRLQHVHRDSCHRRARRHGQRPRLHHRGDSAPASTGGICASLRITACCSTR